MGLLSRVGKVFNPSGDPANSEVEAVRFRLHVDHNGGQPVDLGDVDMWIQSPDGEMNRIYYNFDGFGRDRDDGNEESASIMIGASGDRSNITFALEYDKRDPIFDADRDYTAASWGDYDGDGWQDIVIFGSTIAGGNTQDAFLNQS